MIGTNQDKLHRVRPPRTSITYDVEVGDSIENVELPFVIGVLADLTGMPINKLPALIERNFISIDQENFDQMMATIQPHLNYNLKLAGDNQWLADKTLVVELLFNSIDDFYPVKLIEQIESLNKIYQWRCHLIDFLSKLDGNDSLIDLVNNILIDPAMQRTLTTTYMGKPESEWSDIKLDQVGQRLITDGEMIFDDSQLPMAKKMIGAFVTVVLNPGRMNSGTSSGTTLEASKHSPDCIAVITSHISSIDVVLSDVLSLIMHHPKFRRLEGTWRGLAYLVNNAETGDQLKIKILDVSQAELLLDMTNGIDITQCALHQLLNNDVYGIENSEPYSVLIGDYEIGRSADDFTFLRLMSQMAHTVHAPFITNVYAKSFDQTDMIRSQKLNDLSEIFNNTELMYWRDIQSFDLAHFVTLTLPRIMIRLPYDPQYNPVEGFNFVEQIDGTESSNFAWSGSAFALAQRIANAFSLYHWTAAIQGVEDGGLVENLPVYTFNSDKNEKGSFASTEIVIKSGQAKGLDNTGFMSICHKESSNNFAFVNSKYHVKNKQRSSNVDSSSLPYLLTACRFAHYIKVIMHNKMGSLMTRGNVEDYLNTWISQYVLLDDSPPQEIKARYPLRGAKVQVSELPGSADAYQATLFIKPYFQLEELSGFIRIQILVGT